MIVVQYLRDRDCTTISGIPSPFAPGSLELRQMGNLFAVASPHQDTLICAWAPYTDWALPDGTPFADADSAATYLAAATATRITAAVDISSLTVAAVAMAAGTPVAVSRSDGQLVPARADTKALSFVVGLISADITAGFAAMPRRGAVTLPDWTAVTGTTTLVVGQPYFLDAAGGLTPTPDRSQVACIVRIGLPSGPSTLVVRPYDPVQL